MKQKWMPTEEQFHLLRAALLKGDKAVSSWKQWRSTLDLDNIDPASYNIIPRLYRNLLELDVNDSYFLRYKGIYRAKWARNQIQFYYLSQLLKHFHKSDIHDVLLLKGAAMIVFQYKDYGIRALGDIDILVRRRDVFKAVKLVVDLGWEPIGVPVEAISEDFISAHHGVGFVNQRRQPELVDLHWQLLPENCGQDNESFLFSNVVSDEIHGVQVHGLDSALLLFHTCVHGLKISPVALIRWIVDAMAILRNSQSPLDWDRLIQAAEMMNLSLPMSSALKYLSKDFDATIPKLTMERLSDIPVTARERTEYYLKTAQRSNYLIAIGSSIWFQHSRLHRGKSFLLRLALFPKYLKGYWGLNSLLLVPVYAARKLMKAIKVAVFSSP